MFKDNFLQLVIATAYLFEVFCEDQHKKPFTLKLLVTLPIGGPIAALGKMCTEPIDLLLRIVNNRSDILPNYNIVADVVDDQCMDNVAVKAIIPFMSTGIRVSNLSSPEYQFGQYLLPRNFSQPPNELAYIPPLLVGSQCTGVCKVIARNVQYFDFINFSAGCNLQTLSDRRVYPNFYRVMTTGQIYSTFIAFAKVMKWTKIAVIAGGNTIDLTMPKNMLSLQRSNITLLGLEYFNDDPTDAILRTKATGARVILSDCYFDKCPSVVCQAYKHGLYGPNIVWVFTASMLIKDLPNRPPNCTTEMVEQIENGAFYFRQVSGDYLSTPIETGMTGAQLDRFLETVVPNLWSNPFRDSRGNCYDNVAPAVYILHNAEMILNSRGSTLRDYILDQSKRVELMEIIRNSTESLKIRIFAGRLRYEPGASDVQVPTGLEQAQNGTRRLVFVDNGVEATYGGSRFKFEAPIVWLTNDGKAPKLEATIIRQHITVSLWVFAIFSFVAILIITTCLTVVLVEFLLRKRRHFSRRRAPTILSYVMLLGVAWLLLLIVVYPRSENASTMNVFCKIAPVIATVGYSLVGASLVTKLTDITSQKTRHNRVPRIKTFRNVPKKLDQIRTGRQLKRVALALGTNLILLFSWYTRSGAPDAITISISSYDQHSDIMVEDVWETCSSEDSNSAKGIGSFIVSLQGGCLLWAVLLALLKQKQHASADFSLSAGCAFIVFPASCAACLVITIAKTPVTMYYSVASILFLMSLGMVVVFIGAHRKHYRNVLRNLRRALMSLRCRKRQRKNVSEITPSSSFVAFWSSPASDKAVM